MCPPGFPVRLDPTMLSAMTRYHCIITRSVMIWAKLMNMLNDSIPANVFFCAIMWFLNIGSVITPWMVLPERMREGGGQESLGSANGPHSHCLCCWSKQCQNHCEHNGTHPCFFHSPPFVMSSMMLVCSPVQVRIPAVPSDIASPIITLDKFWIHHFHTIERVYSDRWWWHMQNVQHKKDLNIPKICSKKSPLNSLSLKSMIPFYNGRLGTCCSDDQQPDSIAMWIASQLDCW